MLSPGSIIDNRYEILAPLAEGGMGTIYRARRILLGDEVAIKVIRGEAGDAVARERFIRESRAAARLRHPAIVSILDFDIPTDGPSYLVMELLSGPSLREEIDARQRFEVEEVCRIIPEVCAALELTHAHSIVHRDIKPANIVRHNYRNAEPVYKLVDFGIANLRQTSEGERLTGAHQFLGTVLYASPEQLSGAEGDARSDIYSLASVVFEMLAGRTPFTGDVMNIISAQMSKTAPRLKTIRPDIPPAIDAAIARGLAKAPEDRFQSAADFAAALTEGAPRISIGSQSGDTATSAGLPGGALGAIYEIGESLGRGRLGSEVFRGVHRTLGYPVAIRILHADSHPNPKAVRERFLREARALQVAHPSIIQVRDFGEEAGSVYVVTDYIPGDSLRKVLTAGGGMPWVRLRSLLIQLIEAARVLHRRDVLLCGLHPDIIRVRPPENTDPDASDTGERLMISTAGIWTAQDLLALQDRAGLPPGGRMVHQHGRGVR